MPVLIADDYDVSSSLDLDKLRKYGESLLELKGLEKSELSIALVSDASIRELNRNYRNRDTPTNVLSFPMLDKDDAPSESDMINMLGDIVISLDTASREAEKSNDSLDDRVLFLLVHGFLHLLGYDHEKSEKDWEEMAGEEKKLFNLVKSE